MLRSPRWFYSPLIRLLRNLRGRSDGCDWFQLESGHPIRRCGPRSAANHSAHGISNGRTGFAGNFVADVCGGAHPASWANSLVFAFVFFFCGTATKIHFQILNKLQKKRNLNFVCSYNSALLHNCSYHQF